MAEEWVRLGYNVPFDWLRNGVWFLVICNRPSDYPHHVTMRVQGALMNPKNTTAYGMFCGIYDSLQDAHEDIPPSAYPLGRQPGDDPAIAEVWML